MENQIFEIIVHSGNARGFLYDALKKVREGAEQKEVDSLLEQAKEEMVIAHNVQTSLITEELSGSIEISLLLIHAQDQLMTTMSEQALIEQMIIMQQEINSLKQ